MKPAAKKRVFSWGAIAVLAIVLVVLAVMQYRWSLQISQATSETMKTNLQNSMSGLRQDLSKELVQACLQLQPENDPFAPNGAHQYAQQFRHWRQTAVHPSLIQNVFLIFSGSDRSSGQKLDPETGALATTALPPEYDKLLSRIRSGPVADPGRPRMMRGPGDERGNFNSSAPPPDFGPRTFHRTNAWAIDENIPALVYQDFAPRAPADSKNSSGLIVLELSPTILRQHLLPELVERYFSGSKGLNFDVAVLTESNYGKSIFYRSENSWNGEKADATIRLFGPPGPLPGFRGGDYAFRLMPPPSHNEGPWRPSQKRDDFGFIGPVHIEPIRYDADSSGWQLVARHKRGSLEAAVAALRLRNLSISFGVLLILALTMALTVRASLRAQNLARLQMEFVAGISHELRTPLAVISSAADNIADGLVGDPERLQRYAHAIKSQAVQLTDLVEKVLLFAANGKAGENYNIQPLRVEDVIEAAVESTAGFVKQAGFTIKTQIAESLPPVAADFTALSQSLQNLITNAVKYGGESRLCSLRARASGTLERPMVTIEVEDHGMGLSAEEMELVFQPFYRTPAAVAAQIRGTGLGLALTKKIVESMRGTVTVSSEVGRGTIFALQIPTATQIADAPQQAGHDIVHPEAGRS